MHPGMTASTNRQGLIIGDGIDWLCNAILNEPHWQARLGAIGDPQNFVTEATCLALSKDMVIDQNGLGDALHFGFAPIQLDEWPPPGWIPSRLANGTVSALPVVDWVWIGDTPMDMPFFDDVLRAFRSRPINRLLRVRTSLGVLSAGAPSDAASPAGLIFHMSRCGSTLLGRMLNSMPGNLVLSEPEPVDAVLRWGKEAGASDGDRLAVLRAMVSALGRRVSGGSGRLFLKLDCWHAAALKTFREAFPATPWIYLFREPADVIDSHIALPAPHTIPPPDEAVEGHSRETQIAASITKTHRAILEQWQCGGGLAVDYKSLREGNMARILRHFGLTEDHASRTTCAEVAKFNAKFPDQPFSAQSRKAGAPMPRPIDAAVCADLATLHGQLLRLAAP